MQNLLLILCLSIGTVFADTGLKSSEVLWKADKVIGGGHHGEVPLSKAELNVKDGKLISGEIHFDLKNVTVTDLSGEWASKFLTHIKSDDFFNVEKYPKAILKIDSVENNVGHANLTIKDVTKHVMIKFNKDGKTYSGKVVFDRTDYGIIYGSNNFFKNLGDKAIANDVEVKFKLEVE